MAKNFFVLSVLLPALVLGFDVERGTILNHQEITKRAILNVTVHVCQDKAQSEGRTFTLPNEPYTVENVLAACDIPDAIKPFYENLNTINIWNIKVDKSDQYTSPGHHFNNEAFSDGQDIVATGLCAVKASNKQGNYQAAKILLGKITHTLQDFYSHSNHIEMGKDAPNANLLKGNGDLGKIAGRNMATCLSCNGNGCNNNILKGINNGQILTSGYLSVKPSTDKPRGKCSHGGPLDGSSSVSPTGGISKDTPDSSHGEFHERAANMAIEATSQLLEDVRAAGGDSAFLQMIGASSGKALCFVVDTSGSMLKEITAVQELTSMIINNNVQQQPSMYILVAFKDPNYGPVFRTTDPEEFKRAIDSLSATGGGDVAEMSLSGLRLALTGAPPGSDIFLFTDAGAKDAHLKDDLVALIENKKSVVNVMLTGFLESSSDFEVYEELALASGGRVIRTPKSQLALATDIVLDSSGSSLVTLLEEVRNPGTSESYTFIVDSDIYNAIAYITGSISGVTYVNPSGDAQIRENIKTTTVGNFRRIQFPKDVGLWEMQVVSDNPYTVKVVGESEVTFIYNFMGPAQGPLGGLIAHGGRPRAGSKTRVELMLIGSDTATVTEAYLIESSGTGQVKGTVTSLGNKEYLAEFDSMPTKGFSVLVKGTNNGIRSRTTTPTFQRLLSGNIKPSSLSVTADEGNGIIEPGVTHAVPFSVSSDNGEYGITATNDQGFSVISPTTLELSGGRGDGKVLITIPDGTEPGTQVTLIIQALAPGGTDTNYAVVSFTVLQKVADYSGPACEVISQTSCSKECSSSRWQVTVRVSDDTDGRGGEGVDTVRIRKGNGTLTSRLASGNGQMVTYEASCCSTQVEIVAVDRVGNVGTCTFSTRIASDATTTASPVSAQNDSVQAASMSPKLVQSSFLCLILSLLVIHYTN